MKYNEVQVEQFYGPYAPLTNEQIDETYGPLNDFERLVAQGTYQYRKRGEQLIEAGFEEGASELMTYVEDRHSRLLKVNE